MPNESILVIDDQKNIRLTVVQALNSLGYDVRSAVDGDDALRQLEQSDSIDLLLLDLKMPGMSGLEVLKKAVEHYPHIKTIIISAHGSVDNAVEAMKLGARDFLQKPFTPQELRQAVQEVLEDVEEAEDFEGLLKAAKSCVRDRQFDEAMRLVKQAIGIAPQRPEAMNLLGELQEITGHTQEAVMAYRAAWSLDPSYKRARENLDRAGSPSQGGPSLLD
ncbi:response regulator [Oscillatoria sp. CS-180]|uniref:response regulator n=1 Tax=Oscillatoria sp. CS-180 TaxID=3021720 RepID=UPI00232D6641|nr:response regulator [Oscillatoria sp. CS-180]MDB9525088.1 response regulator [Oscillatoria sp. CS-180]